MSKRKQDKAMKAIILAGGANTRLYPSTVATSKQLLPVYDKPMIYYPLSTIMLAGIKDILIISSESQLDKYKQLFGDGGSLGLHISYKIQSHPKGIAEALLLGEDFIGNSRFCLILGDNIFYGNLDFLRDAIKDKENNFIFAYEVEDPNRYGVVEFDQNGDVLSIEEKPKQPKSNNAVPGIYVYKSDVIHKVKKQQPSERGELEITDLHKTLSQENDLKCIKMKRGMVWLDAGTPDSLLDSSNFISTIENRQGKKIGCIEEISYIKKFITKEQLKQYIETLPNSPYKNYCLRLL